MEINLTTFLFSEMKSAFEKIKIYIEYALLIYENPEDVRKYANIILDTFYVIKTIYFLYKNFIIQNMSSIKNFSKMFKSNCLLEPKMNIYLKIKLVELNVKVQQFSNILNFCI